MKISNWPYWIKAGLLVAIIGTPLFGLLPEEFSNLATVPWFAGWFLMIAFLIFAPICIVLGIDFVSNTASDSDLLGATVVWFSAVFITFFIVGVFGAFLVKAMIKLKSRFG